MQIQFFKLIKNMAKLILTMLQSSLVSLEVFFLTLLFSIPLALPITMARVSKFKPLSMLANAFLLIIRGTPLMLQLIVVYFGPFYLFKFSLYSGNYCAFGKLCLLFCRDLSRRIAVDFCRSV